MDATERERGADVLRSRMAELQLTPGELAEKAGLDVTTIRALLRGDRSPAERTRRKLAEALEWRLGTGQRLVLGTAALEEYPTGQLLEEIERRCDDC